MFDGKKFLDDNNIYYRHSRENWIETKCLFHDDKSQHLGFNLAEGYFRCWFCKYVSVDDVIKKITKREDVWRVKREYQIKSALKLKISNKNKRVIKKKLDIPGEYLKKIHKQYLIGRNYDPDFLEEKYKIKGTLYDREYKNRIIIPIAYKNRFVSFQSRIIKKGIKDIKYKACKKDDEIIPHQELLYNLDNCRKSFIVMVEGVFDVWRLGDNSAGNFGTSFSKQQLRILMDYDRVYTLFDSDQAGRKNAKKVAYQLEGVVDEVVDLNLKEGDPSELSVDDANYLMNKIIK